MYAGPISKILYTENKTKQYTMTPTEIESINLIKPSSKTIFKILNSPNITESASIRGKYIFNKSLILISKTCFHKPKYNINAAALAISNDIITPETPIIDGRIKRKINNTAALIISQAALYFGLLSDQNKPAPDTENTLTKAARANNLSSGIIPSHLFPSIAGTKSSAIMNSPKHDGASILNKLS